MRRTVAIQREVAVPSPAYEGRGTVIVVLLRIDRNSPKFMDDFCHMLRRQPVVERLFWVTGEDDIVAVLDCASMAEFTDFCETHFEDAPVEGYGTLLSLREYRTEEDGCASPCCAARPAPK